MNLHKLYKSEDFLCCVGMFPLFLWKSALFAVFCSCVWYCKVSHSHTQACHRNMASYFPAYYRHENFVLLQGFPLFSTCFINKMFWILYELYKSERFLCWVGMFPSFLEKIHFIFGSFLFLRLILQCIDLTITYWHVIRIWQLPCGQDWLSWHHGPGIITARS